MWAKPPAAPVIHCGERSSLADGEPQSTVHLFQRLTWGHTTFQPTALRQAVAISLTLKSFYNTVVLVPATKTRITRSSQTSSIHNQIDATNIGTTMASPLSSCAARG